MNKIGKIIILVLLVYAGLVITKMTTSSDYYKTTTELNVRTGAGTRNPVSFTLEKGAEIEVLNKNNNWYKIRYSGRNGYVNSKYLKYSRTVSDKESLTSQQKKNIKLVIIIGVFIPIGVKVFRKIRDNRLLKTVTTSNRGTKSERDLVLKLLKYKIPAQAIFHDLYVKKQNGNFSQIDLAVVTKVGIIVFEVKDYKGWIFGNGNHWEWTQVLAYGKQKYRFYNPIMQNNAHIESLKKRLDQSQRIPFYSIVVFYGGCVFKSINYIPQGTFLVKSRKVLKAMRAIMQNTLPIQYIDKNEVINVLTESVKNGENIETQAQHAENIRGMLGKDRIFD